jgi:tetratricopeptide (TPR) repeat protein
MSRPDNKLSTREQMRRTLASAFVRGYSPLRFGDVKRKFVPTNTDVLYEWMQSQSRIRKSAFPALFTQEYVLLNKFGAPAAASLWQEMDWGSAVLAPFVPLLNAVLPLRQAFTLALLQNRYADAGRLLDDIAEKAGASIWLLGARIALLQQGTGLEAQKAFVTQFRESAPARNVASFVAHYFSIRNEANVTHSSFVTEHERAVAEIRKRDRTLAAVVEFFVLRASPVELDQLAMLLAAGQVGSFVDYYDLLLNAMQTVAALGNPEHAARALASTERLRLLTSDQHRAVRGSLRALCDPIHDGNGGRGTASSIPTKDPVRAAIAALMADESRNGGEWEAYIQHASRPEWLEVGERSCTLREHGERPILAEACAVHLHTVRWALSGSARAADDLRKTALNVNGGAWSDVLAAYTALYRRPEPDPATDLYLAFAGCGVPVGTPWLNHLRPPAALPGIERAEDSVLEPHPQLIVAKVLSNAKYRSVDTRSVNRSEAKYVSALLSWRRGEYESVLTQLNGASALADELRSRRCLQLRAWALLALSRYEEAVDTVASAIVAQSDVVDLFPVKQLAESIPYSARQALGAHTALGIFYDYATKLLGIKYDVARKDAFEDFLAAHHVARPSALPVADLVDDGQYVVHFLRYVCTTSVLVTSLGGYADEDDLISERLKVCSILIGLDPNNANAYEDEIKSLTRELRIGRGVREIDQNRVNIDLEAVRKVVTASVAESFARLMAFAKAGVRIAPHLTDAEMEAIVRASRREVAASSLSVPINEPASILSSIVQDIADIFFESPACGLERYLGTRIRHGVLEGRLRTPLQTAHLVSAYSVARDRYEENRFWVRTLQLDGTTQERALVERLAKFSRAYDTLTQRIAAKWIRATRTDGTDVAVFAYEVRPEFVRLLADLLVPGTTLELFVDFVLDSMKRTLVELLPKAQHALSVRGSREATELVSSLERDVYRICASAGVDVSEFEAAIVRGRTAMQREFDHVSSWFQVDSLPLLSHFTIEDAVDVAVRSVQAIFRGFDADVETIGDSQLWRGQAVSLLTKIVDVLFPALQNAAQHGAGGPAASTAHIRIEHSTPGVRVSVTNALSGDVDVAALRERLRRLRSEQRNGTYLDSVSGKGGTGLHKLRSHLDELIDAPSMSFDVRDSRFVVEFALPHPQGTDAHSIS